jgi:hypothetical protein
MVPSRAMGATQELASETLAAKSRIRVPEKYRMDW